MSVQDAKQHTFRSVLAEPLRVLVTDDDPIMREFASVYLGSENASVVTAECGEAGLQRIAAEAFDVVLLDIDMPGLSGFDVLKLLRQDLTHVSLPVIVVTSNEDVASIDRAFALGATSFVVKPVNWRLLAYQLRFLSRRSEAICTCGKPS